MVHEKTLTRDQLKKRMWKGEEMCSFCRSNESIEHIFFQVHGWCSLVEIGIGICIAIPKSVNYVPWGHAW
jgi:hypothetical protein